MLQKLNSTLKIIIILLLILIAILSIIYKYEDCAKCNFIINDTEVSAKQLLLLYGDKCFKHQNSSLISPLPLGEQNICKS